MEVWFKANNLWGKKCSVYDSSGQRLNNIIDYDPVSRMAKCYVEAEESEKSKTTTNNSRTHVVRIKIENDQAVTEFVRLPNSYIVVNGVKY